MKNFVKQLEKYDYLICDFATKKEILKLRNLFPWLKVKVLTESELVAMFLGRVDEETLIELLAKYNFNLEHAKIINENLIFLHDSSFNTKTSGLSIYRRQLLLEGYIKVDEYASFAFEQKKVLMFEYLKNHTLIHKLLTNTLTIDYIDKTLAFSPSVTTFKTAFEEIYYVLNEIALLLHNGVPASKIKVIRPTNDYLALLLRLARQFNILFKPQGEPLLYFPEVKSVLSDLEKGITKLDEVKTTLSKSDNSVEIALYNLLQTINFAKMPPKIHLEYLRSALKAETLALTDNDGISLIDELPQVDFEDKHYFYLNFAQGVAPVIPSGSRLLTFEETKELGILSVDELSLLNEEKLISALTNIKNIHLSFGYIFNDKPYSLSPLVTKLELNTKLSPLPNKFFSQQYFNYITALEKDGFRDYKVVSERLQLLDYSNPENTKYRMFNYQFKGINYEHPLPLKLSFTSYDQYINLPFDYFVSKLLHIVEKGSFAMDYGSFVHKVLEESQSEESFERNFHYYIDHYDFSIKDKFFVLHRKPIVKANFLFLKDYNERSRPSNVIKELYIATDLNENVRLSGKIDRLHIYQKDDKQGLAVFDYKTGKVKMGNVDIEKGFDMQLPVYSLLLAKDNRFNEYELCALAMNSLKVTSYSLQDDEYLSEVLEKSLKFRALLPADTNLVSLIDPTYVDSEFYHGVRIQKNGNLSVRERAIPFDELATHAEKKILEVAARILDNDFIVEKTLISGKRKSGQHSNYLNISYINADEPENFEEETDE